MSFAEYLMQDRTFIENRIKEQDEYLDNLDVRLMVNLTIDRYKELASSARHQRRKFAEVMDRIIASEQPNNIVKNEGGGVINSERVEYLPHYINL